jgi:hypothetical protein
MSSIMARTHRRCDGAPLPNDAALGDRAVENIPRDEAPDVLDLGTVMARLERAQS